MTKQLRDCIFVINGGSSSLKFAMYRMDNLKSEFSGSISPIGSENGKLTIHGNQQQLLAEHKAKFTDINEAVKTVITWIKAQGDTYFIAAFAHRLVQGGPQHRRPELITENLLATLKKFVYLAPNHLPAEMKSIKTFRSYFPDVPHIACFDTAFHENMPSYVKHYPLPEQYQEMGLLKYGFHGLSYQYILQELIAENPKAGKEKIIIAHLGNGASMAAVKNSISVDTTMGVSPVGGLIMSTRSGDLDPGVPLFLLKQGKLTPDQLDQLLSKGSGLKAISGYSDIQELLAAEANDPKAAEAITAFCYSARKFIGALAAGMGGLDRLVFTGGIGENAATIRSRICLGLEFIGIELDGRKNMSQSTVISKKKSGVTVQVIPTNEAFMMAKLVSQLLIDKTKR